MTGPQPGTSGIVRRSRIAPFIPPSDPDDTQGPAVSRTWAARSLPVKSPELTRNRQLAGDLPDWEPLPPGETLVRRHRS